MRFERYAHERITDAIESGELTPREGLGEPLGTLDPDPDWWVRSFLERERLPELAGVFARSHAERLASAVDADDLAEARAILAGVNRDVVAWNADVPFAFRLEEFTEVWLISERAKRPAT